MPAKRIGIAADVTMAAWQRDAVTKLQADGAVVVRIPAARGILARRRTEAFAARSCRAFALVAWDDAKDAAGETLDAVIRFGSPEDQGSAITAPCVLEVVIPGEPPCFAAVDRGDATIALRIDRIAADGTRSVVVRANVACDPTSYGRTLRRVARAAADLPRQALARVAAGDAGLGPADAPAVTAQAPSSLRAALFAVRCALRRVRDAASRIAVTERWSVGVLTTPLAEIVCGAKGTVKWLPLDRSRFWADPFPLPRAGGVDLLCEGYDYRLDRGFLVRVALDADGTTGKPKLLDGLSGHHRSYPYVLSSGTTHYVVPEESEARRVTLYAIEGTVMQKRAVLIDGVAAVDPTPFSYAGRWWMFLTDRDRDDNGELLLYSADELLGPWSPHPLNPIVRDARCARPAGTPFVVEGRLYRPGQDCSHGYGSRIAIARVDVLTGGSYRETIVAHLEPRGPRGRRGMHTLAANDSIILVDGKDVVFDAAASLAMLRRQLRGIWARMASAARSPGDLRPAASDSAASREDSSVPATL